MWAGSKQCVRGLVPSSHLAPTVDPYAGGGTLHSALCCCLNFPLCTVLNWLNSPVCIAAYSGVCTKVKCTVEWRVGIAVQRQILRSFARSSKRFCCHCSVCPCSHYPAMHNGTPLQLRLHTAHSVMFTQCSVRCNCTLFTVHSVLSIQILSLCSVYCTIQ